MKVIGLSADTTTDHQRWAAAFAETQGAAPGYPVIVAADFRVAKLYRMLPVSVSGDQGVRTPADNQTVRNVFVTRPDKKVKLVLAHPMTTGTGPNQWPPDPHVADSRRHPVPSRATQAHGVNMYHPQIVVIDTPVLGDRSYLAHHGTVAVVIHPKRDTDRVPSLMAEGQSSTYAPTGHCALQNRLVCARRPSETSAQSCIQTRRYGLFQRAARRLSP